jgi:hypothetical protein
MAGGSPSQEAQVGETRAHGAGGIASPTPEREGRASAQPYPHRSAPADVSVDTPKEADVVFRTHASTTSLRRATNGTPEQMDAAIAPRRPPAHAAVQTSLGAVAGSGEPPVAPGPHDGRCSPGHVLTSVPPATAGPHDGVCAHRDAGSVEPPDTPGPHDELCAAGNAVSGEPPGSPGPHDRVCSPGDSLTRGPPPTRGPHEGSGTVTSREARNVQVMHCLHGHNKTHCILSASWFAACTRCQQWRQACTFG